MRQLLLLFLFLLPNLFAISAFAGSYQTTDGRIIDPFRELIGNYHTYAGPHLGPGVVSPYANLSFAALHDADLRNADLHGSNMNNVYLPYADLRSANLSGSDLTRSIVAVVDARNANFSGANLTDGNLFETNLSHADLSRANLTDGTVRYAILIGTNFSGAILANLVGLGTTTGHALYDAHTDFAGTGFDPFAAGWTLVPESGTGLLLGFGFAALGLRKRHLGR